MLDVRASFGPPVAAASRPGYRYGWVIERDYQELKQEIGLGHYEGRGWRGFHHHASRRVSCSPSARTIRQAG